MKPGDLVRIQIPPSAHPRDDYLHGMLVIIIGEKYIHPGIPGEYVNSHIPSEYVKGFGDRIRMFPVRWLEALQ
jgi:hypothetical protein